MLTSKVGAIYLRLLLYESVSSIKKNKAMHYKVKINIVLIITLSCLFLSCKHDYQKRPNAIQRPTFQNKGHELVYDMVQKTGDYSSLVKKNNVSYTYTYKTPDGKTDISTEKYIFDGQYSYGKYKIHERTFPQIEGLIEQGYDGKEYWLKANGEVLLDEKLLKRVAFNRPTNFYWFAMMQKLLDPGLSYEYLGAQSINKEDYDIVKVTFNSKDEKPKDIYQLYINKKTSLVEQFLFTVADFGAMEPKLMQLKYEEVEGILIPTKRQYKNSTWNADVTDKPWIKVNWSDIKFNTGITKEDFRKENDMKKDEHTSLKSKLEERKASFALKADDNKKRAYGEGIEAVANSGILSSAKQIGDQAPDFTLNNALGKAINLTEYLKKGKVVLTWYRGGWCPYCNLSLHQLQEELPNFKVHGATLIALTPELPDESISTAEKNDLKFEVLSDLGNKIAKEYGIVFKLSDEVAKMYNQAFELNNHNGDQSNELPLAATYIIDENGVIVYAFLDADYRNRAEPSDLTAFLKNNK